MLRLQGKEAPAFLRNWGSRPSTGPVLTLPERRWQPPLVSKTAYLGVTIGHRAWDADTTARRITAAKWCFRNLRSWLVSDVHPIRTRLKFCKQCVLATFQYGIHEMGLTQQGFRQVISMLNTHHLSIAHSPVCLTHESTTHFLNAFMNHHHGQPSSPNAGGSKKPCRLNRPNSPLKPWTPRWRMCVCSSQISGLNHWSINRIITPPWNALTQWPRFSAFTRRLARTFDLHALFTRLR